MSAGREGVETLSERLREIQTYGNYAEYKAYNQTIDEACKAVEVVATLTVELGAMREALTKCVRQFEDLDEHMPTDAGCIECTAGTVPNHLNTGLCGYHAAKAIASKGPK
jgi:hypothetical protein